MHIQVNTLSSQFKYMKLYICCNNTATKPKNGMRWLRVGGYPPKVGEDQCAKALHTECVCVSTYMLTSNVQCERPSMTTTPEDTVTLVEAGKDVHWSMQGCVQSQFLVVGLNFFSNHLMLSSCNGVVSAASAIVIARS